MTLQVRPVNLSTEQRQLLDLLERNLTDLSHAQRFQWLYRDNPAGPVRSWFVYEQGTERPVGVASVFPRVLWVDGKTQLCGQVGDFAIDVSHRSLGPALLLQRATFEPVKQGTLALCYDCPPHETGMATFRRLGMAANGQMHRYARLLRTDRQIEKYLGQNSFTPAVSLVGNRLLNRMTFRRPSSSDPDIALYAGRFGEEFSLLDREVEGQEIIRGRRAATDLNWRYRDDPLHKYEVFTARRGGELMAFVIFTSINQDAYIVDLFGHIVPDVGVQLLDAVATHLKQQPIQTLQAQSAELSDLRWVLQQAYFRYRSQAAQIVAYAQPGTVMGTLIDKPLRWAFQHTDVLA